MRQLAQNFSSSSSSNLLMPYCGSGHDNGARYVTAFIFLTNLLPYWLIFISNDTIIWAPWILRFALHLITSYSTPCKCKHCWMLNFWKFIHCIQQGWFIIIIRLGTIPFGKLLLSSNCITDSKQRAHKLFVMETFPVMSQQISINDPIFTCNFKIFWTMNCVIHILIFVPLTNELTPEGGLLLCKLTVSQPVITFPKRTNLMILKVQHAVFKHT